MSYQDAEKLRQIEADAATLREKVQTEQARCSHEWTQPIADPYEATEGYGCRLVGLGSDPYTAPAGYAKVTKMRWKRECKKCGKVQHSDKRKQKVVDDGPDFGG